MHFLISIAAVFAFVSCASEPELTSKRSSEEEFSSKYKSDNAEADSKIIEPASAESSSADAQVDEFEVEENSAEEVAKSFSLTNGSDIEQALGTSSQHKYSVTSAAGFEGKVKISLYIESTDFKALDSLSATKITVDPQVLEMGAGETQEVTVTVDVGTQSPSMNMGDKGASFTLVAAGDNDESKEAVTNFSIMPEMRVEVRGVDGASMVWTPDLKDISFRSHADGLTLKFVNMEKNATNIIHGNGDIPHQPTNQPLAPAVGDEDGGTYNVTIADDDDSGSFYSHSYEGGGQRRNVTFNSEEQ